MIGAYVSLAFYLVVFTQHPQPTPWIAVRIQKKFRRSVLLKRITVTCHDNRNLISFLTFHTICSDIPEYDGMEKQVLKHGETYVTNHYTWMVEHQNNTVLTAASRSTNNSTSTTGAIEQV